MAVRATEGGYTFRYDAVASGFAFSGMQMVPTFGAPEKYFVWLSGSTYRAVNNKTGLVEQSGTDFSTMVNTILSDHSGTGVDIRLGSHTFTVQSPISIPVTTRKRFVITGTGEEQNRNTNTTLTVGSSFPTSGRYIFEHIGYAGSGVTNFESSLVEVSNLHMTNLNNFTTIFAGGVRYESNSAVWNDCIVVKNVETNLLYRGIHIIGYVYYGRLEDLRLGDYGTATSGDFFIKFERDYFGWENASGRASSVTRGHGDVPKAFHCENIRIGKGAVGYFKNAILIEGGYNKFFGIDIDGTAYDRPIEFRGMSFSNTMYGVRLQDLNTNPPGNANLAAIVFDASGTFGGGYGPNPASGLEYYAASSGGQAYTCYDNHVYGFRGTIYPATVAFAGSGYRNYIECHVFGGSNIIVNDLNAGEGNIVEINQGQRTIDNSWTKATVSGGRVQIIDKRVGADGRGLFQDSGGKAVYTIPHGLMAAPQYVNVMAASPQAREQSGIPPDVSGGTANINVRYTANTNSGNVWMYWNAEIYATPS